MDTGKPLVTCTLGEFTEALIYYLGISARNDEDILDAPPNKQVKKHYVYGIKGLMQLLGVSRTAASKLKNSGILDDAMSEIGRVTVFDADLVMALLNVRNKARSSNRYHGRKM